MLKTTNQMSRLCWQKKKSISFARGRSKAIRSDSVECRHISDNDE